MKILFEVSIPQKIWLLIQLLRIVAIGLKAGVQRHGKGSDDQHDQCHQHHHVIMAIYPFSNYFSCL